MEQYIKKSDVVAEIEKYISNYEGILNKVDKSSDDWVESTLILDSKIDILQHILSFLDTLEVKDANEALRTEYEKGRADVIAKTLEWINVFNDNNYIMQYSDSCEHPINEIIEWYKNYINRE